MSPEKAVAVYDILVAHAGAPESGREDFIHTQTSGFRHSYRFCGALGMGGKFKRGTGTRLDGSYGEWWHVDAYPEDMNDARQAVLNAVDPLLDLLRQTHEQIDSQRA